MRELVLDTETTGFAFQHHRLVSIAAVELVNKAPTGSFLHFYMNPDRESDPRALQVHGLTTEFLSTKPRFTEVASSLVDYIGGDPLVIHNAPFDMNFLNTELRRTGRPTLFNRQVCTLCEARRQFGKSGNKLDDLTTRFSLTDLRAQTGAHGALVDCLQLINVYRSLVGLVAFPWETNLLGKYLTHSNGRTRERSSESKGIPEVTQPIDTGGGARTRSSGAEQVLLGDHRVHHANEAGFAKSGCAVEGTGQQSGSVIDEAFKTLWLS
jgi:DNA polymerase-3 subunit epsilon